MKLKYTYEEWILHVAEYMQLFYGVHPDDLPDWNYRDAYDSHVGFMTAARRAVRAAGKEELV